MGIYVLRVWVSVSFQWGQWSRESSVTEPEATACSDRSLPVSTACSHWSLPVSILMIWPKAYSLLRTLATIPHVTFKLEPAFSQTAKVLTFRASWASLFINLILPPHPTATSSLQGVLAHSHPSTCLCTLEEKHTPHLTPNSPWVVESPVSKTQESQLSSSHYLLRTFQMPDKTEDFTHHLVSPSVQ